MKKVILLVDDDNDDYDVFREALEETGCEAQLFRAENGADVFEYMADEQSPRPDIIFLDLNMPVMNGWQCLAKLKNTSGLENIPVIMYTTSSHKRDVEIANDLNAHGLITKPSNPKKLTTVLARIICTLGTADLRQAIKDAYLLTQEK